MTQVGDGVPLPGRQKRGKKTREEYLAKSLSRRKPWETEGISRRTYYRRLKQLSGGGTSPARGTSPRGTSPSGPSAARGTNLPGTRAARKPTPSATAPPPNTPTPPPTPLLA